MAATVHFIGVTFYAIFASGELQPWAEPSPEELARWSEEAEAKYPTLIAKHPPSQPPPRPPGPPPTGQSDVPSSTNPFLNYSEMPTWVNIYFYVIYFIKVAILEKSKLFPLDFKLL
jgi:hypothetical protein